jgi:hypothetical protein
VSIRIERDHCDRLARLLVGEQQQVDLRGVLREHAEVDTAVAHRGAERSALARGYRRERRMGSRLATRAELLAILSTSHERPRVDAAGLTLDRHGPYVPEFIAVLGDGAVRRKLATARGI